MDIVRQGGSCLELSVVGRSGRERSSKVINLCVAVKGNTSYNSYTAPIKEVELLSGLGCRGAVCTLWLYLLSAFKDGVAFQPRCINHSSMISVGGRKLCFC